MTNAEPPMWAVDADSRRRRESSWIERQWVQILERPEALVTALVVAACAVFVFVELQPSELFRNTTPAGGDMGAHVWLPAYIKRVLIPHGQIFGWTMDWYAGFPALTYYFPLPMVSIAVISYVIPYNIAFKLVSVAGLIALPIVAYAFGRLGRMRFPGPACLAVGATVYLFNWNFTIYGGNIASTMAGEFCFSVSLAFAVLFLGLFSRGLRTGKGRALSAFVLALCGLSHILPLFFAIGGAVVLWLLTLSLARLWRFALPVGIVGGLLIAFWALPFEYRLPYATNMGYTKVTTYLATLFPNHDLWLFIMAGVGALLALTRRNRLGVFLLIMAILSAFVFRFAPNARLWNARVIPFWYLSLYLLAGVAFAEAGLLVIPLVGLVARLVRWVSGLVDRWTAPPAAPAYQAAHQAAHQAPGGYPGAAATNGDGRTGGWSGWRAVPIPIVTLLVALVWVGFPLRILPFEHVTAKGDNDWLGLTGSYVSDEPAWVTWNYSGYQSSDKSSRSTYFALLAEMNKLGHTKGDGCGRAMYEYEPAINDMGTSDALMLLPYWTNGCIASMEGLYYESSATTPYHFLNAAELSAQPSDPMVGLDYPASPNVRLGIEHLQMFGVKYYMAVTPSVQRAAARDKSLTYLASVGPYPTDVTNAQNQTVIQEQTWKIYKIADSPLVQPLANQPVVAKDSSGNDWLPMSQRWYLDPTEWGVYEAQSGPSSWTRVSTKDSTLPLHPEPKVTVSHIVQKEESVDFDVSRTGVPVLVKVSYFPNWHVQGAKAIYRVTPNLMVVVPDSDHVSLTYGYTPVDWIGLILSLVGLVGLGWLIRSRAPVWRSRRLGRHGRRGRLDADLDGDGPDGSDRPDGSDGSDGAGPTTETPPLGVPATSPRGAIT